MLIKPFHWKLASIIWNHVLITNKTKGEIKRDHGYTQQKRDSGLLPFTKKIGNFPSGSSIQEERVPFEWSLFRSYLSLLLESPAKIQNGGWNVDAARELRIFNRRRKSDKFRRWWWNKYPPSGCYFHETQPEQKPRLLWMFSAVIFDATWAQFLR